MAVVVTVVSPADAAGNLPVRDFLLEADGEIAVRNGDFGVAAGAAAVPQGIACRLRMLLAECYLDETKGTDWLNQILIKNPNVNVVRELIREQILDTPDVTDAALGAVERLAGREARLAASANSIYSATPFAAQVAST